MTAPVPGRHGVFLLASTVCVLLVDQSAKRAIESAIAVGERVAVIEGFFYLTNQRNPGAAFGFLAGTAPPLRVAILAGAFALAVLVIVSIYRSLAAGQNAAAAALGLVLGGAVSNMVDRVWFANGAAIDFINLQLWSGYRWPDFNLADVCIAAGIAMLVSQVAASEGASRARIRRQTGSTVDPDEPPG